MQNVAANSLSEHVSVVHRDIGLLQRGREVRALGANVAIADIFDAGKNPTLRVYSWQVTMTSTHLFDFANLQYKSMLQKPQRLLCQQQRRKQ